MNIKSSYSFIWKGGHGGGLHCRVARKGKVLESLLRVPTGTANGSRAHLGLCSAIGSTVAERRRVSSSNSSASVYVARVTFWIHLSGRLEASWVWPAHSRTGSAAAAAAAPAGIHAEEAVALMGPMGRKKKNQMPQLHAPVHPSSWSRITFSTWAASDLRRLHFSSKTATVWMCCRFFAKIHIE